MCSLVGARLAMTDPSDEELVRRTRAGDDGAFGVLARRYERPLFNAAYRITGGYHDAGDALQSALLRAYRSLASCDTSRGVRSWLTKIVVNESLRIVAGRRSDRAADDLEVPEDRATPEEELRRAESDRALQDALGGMSLDHRTVIVLRHFHDLSYREIADMLDLPKKTVKSRLFEARVDLRRRLLDRGMLR